MNIRLEKNAEQATLKVDLGFRGKRGKSIVFTTQDAIDWIFKNYPEIKLGEIIYQPEKVVNNMYKPSGVWKFKIKKENIIDIENDYVKIDKTIEADSQKEKQKEASLPNGLKKITKTKRKRAPRKKKTEE